MAKAAKEQAPPQDRIDTLGVDEIQVPELRVTSQVDPHILEELRASISKDGILQPLQVAKVGETYVLEDGLHRLMVARELGIERVPVIVHLATEAEVLVRNLILNRQRGKSNPAQEIQVIRFLIENEGKTGREVSGLTGLSEGWVSRLYDLNTLPDEVLNLISEGLLGVTSAWHLTKLEDGEQMIQVARDAANWKYTEHQVKTRVDEVRGTRPPVQPGEVIFNEENRPVISPLTCYFCHCELEKGQNYIWVCPEHLALIQAFWQQYLLGVPAEAGVAPLVARRTLVLTDQGWYPPGG